MLSHFSRVQLFVTTWTVAHQAPLSMGFSRQECWTRLSCPPPGDLPDPGIRPVSFISPALAGQFSTPSTKVHGECWASEATGLLLWQASSPPLAPRYMGNAGLVKPLVSCCVLHGVASLDQRVRDSILMAHPLNKEVSAAEELQRIDFLVCC